MKRFIPIPFFLIIFSCVSLAIPVEELNTTIDIQKDETVVFDLNFRFLAETEEVYLPFPYEVRNLNVDGGKCEFNQNMLVCRPYSPFAVGSINIEASFVSNGMIKTKDNKSSFVFDITLLNDVEKMNVALKLPELMAIVDNKMQPISPAGEDIGSDGRRIIVKWNFRNKLKGDIIPIRVYYENLNPTNFLQIIDPRLIIFLLFVIGIGVFLIYNKISRRSAIVLSVLNEAEKIAVNIIQQNGGKDVDQRLIVGSCGFSKAKVTRILQSLEARGVVSLIRSGRKNKVTLKKKFVEDKTEQST